MLDSRYAKPNEIVNSVPQMIHRLELEQQLNRDLRHLVKDLITMLEKISNDCVLAHHRTKVEDLLKKASDLL